MVATVAVEGGDADGLKGLPFGVEPFLTRSVGSEVEVDTVHVECLISQHLRRAQARHAAARQGLSASAVVWAFVPARHLAAKLGQRHAGT
jgi:hypothetical protein